MITPLIAHNFYQQPGGEDQVFAAETELLRSRGNRVLQYTVHNDGVRGLSSLSLARNAIWSSTSYRALRTLIRTERPEVLHVHNTMPLLSPAVYLAARHEGIAVVQTLHNYRMVCVNAMLFRAGNTCELCLRKRTPWPGVAHACYRGDRAASAVVASTLAIHRLARTYSNQVDLYIALTEFARNKMIEGGLPAKKIRVKPNFLPSDPGVGEGKGDYALFVGRLSAEKGVHTLLDAWAKLKERIPLKIIGGGPLESYVSERVKDFEHVEFLGYQPSERVLAFMKDAYMLVFPSVWYEGLPMTIIEAYAVGLPIIASDLGSMSSLVRHGETGLRFRAADPVSLSNHVQWAYDRAADWVGMRQAARETFLARYTADKNYEMLIDVYEAAIANSARAAA